MDIKYDGLALILLNLAPYVGIYIYIYNEFSK